MSTLYDLAGTTSHSFKLGGSKGINISFGESKPLDDFGNIGDIFVRTTTQLTPDEEFDSYARMEANMTDMHNDFIASGQPFFYVVLDTDERHSNSKTLYKYDGTNVEYLDNFGAPLGKIYYKTVTKNGITWLSLGTYHFDEPIIQSVEDTLNQGDFFVSLKNADNKYTDSSGTIHTPDKTTSQSTDYNVNHDNYGVVRFATDDEAVASNITNYKTYTSIPSTFNKNTTNHKFEDKFIAMTPEQVGKDIKVEMTRAINVEGYLKNLQTTNGRFDPTPNLVGAINELDTDIGKLADYNTSNERFTTTPNIVGAINELDAAIGKLSTLKTSNKSNVVNAINSELDARIITDNDLQRQINALASRSDVVDVVACYDRGSDTSKTDIAHYDTSKLNDDDIVKVLDDETHQHTVAYWRYKCVPEEALVKVATKAALDAYDTSHLQTNDIAIVESDSSHSNRKTYYKLNSSKQWVYQGEVTERWEWIGSVESYYTTEEADSMFMHKTTGAYTNETVAGNKTFSGNTTITGTIVLGNNATATKPALNDNSALVATTEWVNDTGNNVVHKTGDETIEGAKTFKNKDVYIKSSTLDVTDQSITGYEHLAFTDKNDKELGHVKLSVENGKNMAAIAVCPNGDISNFKSISVSVDNTTLETVTSCPQPTHTTSTTSNQIATVGWANSASVGNNIVHKTGTETIGGTKTFSSNVNVPLAPTANTHATSKKYVDDGLATKQNTIPITQADTNFFLSNDGTNLEWRQVRDLTNLYQLDDVNLDNNKQNEQVLMYDSTSQKWINGNPVVATIKYW